MEFYKMEGPMQCNTIDAYDDSIQKENRLSDVYLTREEFLHQLAQLQAENKIERLQNLEEREATYNALIMVNDRVKANYAQGLSNGAKIGNLEDKVEVVNQKFEDLDDKIDNLSRKCLSLKQRLMEEIPKITEKETMERTKPTQLSPNVSNGSSIITLEMADLCAKAVFISNHDVNFKDNNKKSNSINRKVSSNQNKPRFSCEICGHGNLLKRSLSEHKRRKHSMTSRVSGENPNVKKGFWCTHCNKKYVHAQNLAKHESVCVKKLKPSATASATMDSSSRTVQESGKLDPSISLATPVAITDGTDGPTN